MSNERQWQEAEDRAAGRRPWTPEQEARAWALVERLVVDAHAARDDHHMKLGLWLAKRAVGRRASGTPGARRVMLRMVPVLRELGFLPLDDRTSGWGGDGDALRRWGMFRP